MSRLERSPKLLLACCALAAAGEVAYPPPEALRLVETALKQNPALNSAHLSAQAAHSTGVHHGAWEAPEVGVDFFQTPIRSFPNPLKNQQEIDYSVSQRIPFPGKLDAMAKPQHLHSVTEERRAEFMELELRRDVLSACADLYSVEWRLKWIREDRIEVGHLLGAARTGYEGGMGSQADLLRMESEAARLDAEVLEAEQEGAETRATIASLLGGGKVDFPAMDSLAPAPLKISTDSLQRLAMDRRPDLDAMHEEIAMADAELASKKLEAYPDFAVQGMYKDMRTDMGARGFWSVGLGMKVPIAPWSWKGVQAGVDAARVEQRKSEQDYNAARSDVNADVERAAAALRTASSRIEVAQARRIPLADQTLRSALSSYQGGRADFNGVITAFRELRDARDAYHRAVADHLKAWAALEWATGGILQ